LKFPLVICPECGWSGNRSRIARPCGACRYWYPIRADGTGSRPTGAQNITVEQLAIVRRAYDEKHKPRRNR